MLKIRAQRTPWAAGVELLIVEHRGGRRYVAEPITMAEASDDGLGVEPTATIDPAAAQALMDDLWHCGLRPSEGSGSAGSLAATERHLKDMQAIAFAALKFDKP